MPEISLTVANADFWEQELDGIHGDTLRNINNNMLRAAHNTGAEFLAYPPPPPKSTYIRTGNLAESVKVIAKSNGYVVSIDPVSPQGVHYGTYVIGDADGHNQAWMHKGRWRLLKDEADKQERKMFDNAVSQMQADIRERGIG